MHHGILAVTVARTELSLSQRLMCELIVYQWISCPSPIYRLSSSPSYLQPLGQHMETPYGGPTFYQNGPCCIPKMAVILIYSRNPFLKYISQNNLRTWYIEFSLHTFFNDNPRLALIYLTSLSNLLPNAFKWGFFKNFF